MGEQNFDAHNIYEFKTLQYTQIRARNLKPGPVRRNCLEVVAEADSKNIYIFVKKAGTTNIWIFNFNTRKWTTYIMNVATNEIALTMIVKNDVLMIYRHWNNELYICHLNSANNFCARLAITIGEPPSTLYHQDVVCQDDDEYLYAVGGRSGYDVQRINLSTLVLETMYVRKENGENKQQNAVVSDGKNIFIFKISIGSHVPLCIFVSFFEISIFNIEKKKWTTRNTVGDSDISCNNGYPNPTGNDYCDMYKSHHDSELKLYIRQSGNILVWKLDVNTFQWTQICQLLLPFATPCDVIASAISRDGSKHYIINNSEFGAHIFVNWLGIPKLSEMCWEAVLHYYYLKVFDKKELIRAGVPVDYVNKIE